MTANILEVSSLSRRFPGRVEPALDSVSFSVQRGDFIVISGANGSGKSVLMNLIAGLDKPTRGQVTVASEGDKAARVGLVFQDADAQILGDTIEEDVFFGLKNLGYGKKECTEISERTLERVGLAGRGKEPSRTLSGGEKRRLAVAGILAMDAEIIIFDEPYANLDWPGVVQVNAILHQLRDEGKTILVLTHELEKVLGLSNRLLVLFRGKLVHDGPSGEALDSAPFTAWGIKHPLSRYEDHADLVWDASR